jgi:hypothetical protein
MTDDLKDIDPEIVEAVLANADAFIDADKRVDDIISWGENELKTREQNLEASGGTLQDFKKAATEIESQVAEKLKDLESEIQNRYPEPTSSS